MKTSFSKTAELSFPENSNDELFYANEIDFEKVKHEVNAALEQIFPERSSFERK